MDRAAVADEVAEKQCVKENWSNDVGEARQRCQRTLDLTLLGLVNGARYQALNCGPR